jgi:hypothetical protein
MKRILIIAGIGGISFIAGYFIAKKRTEGRLEPLLDEMGETLYQSIELLEENDKYLDEVFGPLDDEDDDDKEDFCYDE